MAANVHIIIGPSCTGKTTEIARQVKRRIQYAMGEPDPVAVFSLTKAAAAEAAGSIKSARCCVPGWCRAISGRRWSATGIPRGASGRPR